MTPYFLIIQSNLRLCSRRAKYIGFFQLVVHRYMCQIVVFDIQRRMPEEGKAPMKSKNYGNNLPYQQRPQPITPQHGRSHKNWPWIGGIFVILVLLASLVGYLNLRSEMQNYPQLGSGSLTWQVCAIEPRRYHWHVLITLVDKNEKVLASQSPLLMGEQVKIQVEVLKLLGTSSAYKINTIKGFYTNPRDERNLSFPRNTITLDDGKTPLFSATNAQTWLSWLVNASSDQSLVLNKDGKTYGLSETQNGFKLVAEKNSLPLCGFPHSSV